MSVTRRSQAGWMIRGFFFLLLAVAGAVPAAAQEAGRIVGRVTDGVGNPVAGARVTLVDADSTREARTVVTGETGVFEFAGLPAGGYRVRVASGRYSAPETAVLVEPGELESVIARLREGRRGAMFAEQRVTSDPRRTP